MKVDQELNQLDAGTIPGSRRVWFISTAILFVAVCYIFIPFRGESYSDMIVSSEYKEEYASGGRWGRDFKYFNVITEKGYRVRIYWASDASPGEIIEFHEEWNIHPHFKRYVFDRKL
ncbi:hypothetical protein [Shewanella algae]|uniref:hypothetical protein n=1 Tax=Shewanella algae TaxID=38313 RepID=UPI0031F58902